MMVKRRAALPSANRPPPTSNPNRLLAALPAADYARILPSLTVVPLKLKEMLHKPGEPIRRRVFSRRRVLFDVDRARRWRHGGDRDHRPRRDGRRIRPYWMALLLRQPPWCKARPILATG